MDKLEYALVALDVPLYREFVYACGDFDPAPGARVIVPFGVRRVAGVVLERVADPGAFASRVRAIFAQPDDMPALDAATLALCRFVARYYQHPLGQVLATALPVVFRGVSRFEPTAPERWLRALDADNLLASLSARASAQRQLADFLRVARSESELRAFHAQAMARARQWLADGLLELVTPQAVQVVGETPPELTRAQQAALSPLFAARGFAPFLLFGVTGSGKTEVYLRLIEQVLARGGQVLVLVPEINLTPQLEARFRRRFPAVTLASLHSGLNDRQRAQNWLDAAEGRAGIVLGTRLAVFTPMPRLALIVVDEEHDSSFKQQEGLRYHARDVAIYRARQAQVPVVLGSATPSMESWHNAQQGRFQLLELPQRAVRGAQMPALRVLPMKLIPASEALHPLALERVRAALAAGLQALIFINRRGYAPVLACTDCGWMSSCPHCSARLVLHLGEQRLRCHHCGFEQSITPACPDCGNPDLRPVGHGTQRLEQTLQQQLPQARLLRIDRDSTRRRGELDAALQSVHDGAADVLIGTQMLAKGHDFERLACVVVLNADSGLYSMDLRAEERLYALLTQVAGRAGRHGQGGEVLIQSLFPEHPFFAQLSAGDFGGFAARVLQERREMHLPPFAYWAMLRAESADDALAQAFLQQASQCLPLIDGVEVHTPVQASMQRRAGMTRWQVLLASPRREALQAMLAQAMPAIAALPAGGVRWLLDVDPLEL